MLLPRFFRATIFAAILCFHSSCATTDIDDESYLDAGLPEIALGKEVRLDRVSICATQEDAEQVLVAHRSEGVKAAFQKFSAGRCFTATLTVTPQRILGTSRTNGRTMRLIETDVRISRSTQTVLYLITFNPIVIGIRI